MRKNLRVLYRDGEPLPAWGESEGAELHAFVDRALCSSDSIAVVALHRDEQGARVVKCRRMQRGVRTSIYELAGALQAAVADWFDGD
jgi:hypothetical protein